MSDDELHNRKMELVAEIEERRARERIRDDRRMAVIYSLPDILMNFKFHSFITGKDSEEPYLLFGCDKGTRDAMEILNALDMLPISQVITDLSARILPDCAVDTLRERFLGNGSNAALHEFLVTPLAGNFYLSVHARHSPKRKPPLNRQNTSQLTGWIRPLDAPVRIVVILADDPVSATAVDRGNEELRWVWRHDPYYANIFPRAVRISQEGLRENEMLMAFTKSRSQEDLK